MMNNTVVLNTTHSAARIIDHLDNNPHIIPVFDLDCVLLDASHRITLNGDGSLDLEKYRADSTIENIMQDKNLPLMSVVHALNYQKRPYHVATARVLCEGSQQLLKVRGVNPQKVISRNGEDDRRKDWDLKVAGIQDNFKPEQFKDILLIDDCTGNCDAFINALGAMAINVDYNNTPKPWLQELL